MYAVPTLSTANDWDRGTYENGGYFVPATAGNSVGPRSTGPYAAAWLAPSPFFAQASPAGTSEQFYTLATATGDSIYSEESL